MKFLVCAYSCVRDPDERFGDGGEGILGEKMVEQISRFGDVLVLTHYKNKSAIEAKFFSIKNINFVYIGLPRIFNILENKHVGIQLYAYFWQIKAFFVAKQLHRKHNFDLFHHITYANDWMASFIGALLPIPYFRGPGGGAHKIPKAFLVDYSLKEKFLEGFRSFSQAILRLDPFFVIGHNRARKILVCNKEAYNALPAKWQKKAEFFPVNGIDKNNINPNITERENKIFKVISAGRLLKLKNFDLAIKAFALLNQKYPDSSFEIIGRGPEEKKLKIIANKEGVAEKVIFSGWTDRANLFKKIRESDVFLFASLRDGGGAVIVEAMAQGLPVVCFDIAGPGFHVQKEWGIKIKPKNSAQSVNDMAKALEELYENKKLRINLGEKAIERVKEFYDWNILGKRLKEIYDKDISKK